MSDPNANVSHFYELTLEPCQRLFDNELRQPALDKQIRLTCMYRIKECFHPLGSWSRASARFNWVIFTNFKGQELVETLKRDRNIPSLTMQGYLNT